MSRVKFILIAFCIVITSCSTSSEKEEKDYVKSKNEVITPEVYTAMKKEEIINGMTMKQVQFILGEPAFVEKISEYTTRWIYRDTDVGIYPDTAYPPPSAFPQGIGFIIPLNYNAMELRVDFEVDEVIQVQRILRF